MHWMMSFYSHGPEQARQSFYALDIVILQPWASASQEVFLCIGYCHCSAMVQGKLGSLFMHQMLSFFNHSQEQARPSFYALDDVILQPLSRASQAFFLCIGCCHSSAMVQSNPGSLFMHWMLSFFSHGPEQARKSFYALDVVILQLWSRAPQGSLSIQWMLSFFSHGPEQARQSFYAFNVVTLQPWSRASQVVFYALDVVILLPLSRASQPVFLGIECCRSSAMVQSRPGSLFMHWLLSFFSHGPEQARKSFYALDLVIFQLCSRALQASLFIHWMLSFFSHGPGQARQSFMHWML